MDQEIRPIIEKKWMSKNKVNSYHFKYKGYIKKEQQNADKLHRLENLKIPADIDYHVFGSMSIEARQKLTKIKPATVAQASRISGVSPADISVLLIYMGR